MSRCDETLCLSIEGIDNAFEISGLLRLFLSQTPTLMHMAGTWAGNLPDAASTFACVARLEAVDATDGFSAEAWVFRDGLLCGHGACAFSRTPAATERPSDLLLKSPKLCAGNAMYEALAEAFGTRLPWGSLTGVRPVKLASALLSDDISTCDAHRFLTDRTGMSAEKASLLLEVARNEQTLLEMPKNSVSVYVGIPFCTTRCLYCSFPAHAIGKTNRQVPAYLDALARELQFLGTWMRQAKAPLSTLYVGGGTPTALSEEDLDRLMHMLHTFLPVEEAMEFTVEAGRPDTLTPAKLETIRAAGASRISINPQSMRDETLRRIGRGHTAAQVRTAFAMARAVGFDNINADLIAGLPGESVEDFRHTLRELQPLAPDSLTVHTLSVKRSSRLHERLVDGTAEVQTADDVVACMVADAAAFARENGLAPYYLYRQKNILANLENVGYARPGMGCRYNVETMSERQTILAAGSGAVTKVSHGGRDMERTENVRELSHYIHRIDEMITRKQVLLTRHFGLQETE